MALPSRPGTRVPAGNSSATGSSILTSPRLAMSDSNSAVKSLVIEPISNKVFSFTGPTPLVSRQPWATIRWPLPSVTPTTMPTLKRRPSTRSISSCRIASSDKTRGGTTEADTIMTPTRLDRATWLSHYPAIIITGITYGYRFEMHQARGSACNVAPNGRHVCFWTHKRHS
jgi:hypothetical protein